MTASKNNISSAETGKQVQDRLLDAAERLFAKKGFDGASVRDITSQADCNVAAVNYHFGGKDKLYLDVLRRRMHMLRSVRIVAINEVMSQSKDDITLEALLGTFARAFIEPLFDQSKGRRFMELMTREMFDPRLAPGMFLEEAIIPVLTVLQQALLKVCPGLDEKKAALSIQSIVAQLLHTVHAKKMFEQIDNVKLPAYDIAEIVDHIVEFSAAGIRASVKREK